MESFKNLETLGQLFVLGFRTRNFELCAQRFYFAGQIEGAAGLPPGGELAALESGYVRAKATELGRSHGVPINWDVLHGEPAKAIASYVAGRGDTILAMVTRRQSAMETAFLGSVTAGCLRQAGVPVLMRAP